MSAYHDHAKAIQWAVKTYSAVLTDRQIAEKYKVPVYLIERARQRLGIRKSGGRIKKKMVQ